MDTTYRIIGLEDRENYGPTATTPELAKLAAGEVQRELRLSLERTDWGEDRNGRPKPYRIVITDVEETPGEWDLGINDD